MGNVAQKLSTGVEAIDRQLEGGLPPGNLLALVTPPGSQSESLVHHLMRERPTKYLSTLRWNDAVEDGLRGVHDFEADVTVEYVGKSATMDNKFFKEVTGNRAPSIASTDENVLLNGVYDAIEAVDRTSNVVVDPTNPLERTEKRNAYQEVLNYFKQRMIETESIGVLHCIASDSVPPLRGTTLTVADTVWELEIVSVPTGIEHQLTIPKNRGGNTVSEKISLEINRQVHVDNSRNI